ncbi:peptidylprolyl isomerase [Vulcanococcus limneticus]|uniref:peptidylprolyl isomerase n=1 Tax=Vulcanococcus limneticus TaxID=2170428 RepID=UPI00398BBD36
MGCGDRRARLIQELGSAWPFLLNSGFSRLIVKAWIRKEIAEELNHSHLNATFASGDDEESSQKHGSDEQKESTTHWQEAVVEWSRQQWQSGLQSQFLQRREELAWVTCSLLKVSDKRTAHELYYRIKDGEATFADICKKHGLGSESMKGGSLPKQRLHKLPYGLPAVIRTMKAGDLTTPCKLGESIAIIKLWEIEPAVFDESVSGYLLNERYKDWSLEAYEYISTVLTEATSTTIPE